MVSGVRGASDGEPSPVASRASIDQKIDFFSLLNIRTADKIFIFEKLI